MIVSDNEVNRTNENSSFIPSHYVKTVPVYDVRLVWVVLHPFSKECFKTIYYQEQNNDVLFIDSF